MHGYNSPCAQLSRGCEKCCVPALCKVCRLSLLSSLLCWWLLGVLLKAPFPHHGTVCVSRVCFIHPGCIRNWLVAVKWMYPL